MIYNNTTTTTNNKNSDNSGEKKIYIYTNGEDLSCEIE